MFTVIIVNYNSTNRLNKLLKSLNFISPKLKEVIIVDNNSNDLRRIQKSKFKIRLFKNRENFGFAKAINLGIGMSNTNIVLLLNPDTLILDNSPLKTFNLINKQKNNCRLRR